MYYHHKISIVICQPRAQDLSHLTLALFEAGWWFTGAMRRVANAEAGQLEKTKIALNNLANNAIHQAFSSAIRDYYILFWLQAEAVEAAGGCTGEPLRLTATVLLA